MHVIRVNVCNIHTQSDLYFLIELSIYKEEVTIKSQKSRKMLFNTTLD